MPGLPSREATEPGRSCAVFLGADPEGEGDWSLPGCERLFELLDEQGRSTYTLDVRSDSAARLWGSERGSFFIDGDGSAVRCYPMDVGEWQWRRFLIGQVLPFVALRNGLEILHASGVAIDGQGLVFAGPNRAGKSSVAAHLVLNGAELIADDVVSIERRDGTVVAYPGTAMIGLRREERTLWPEAELELLGATVAQNEDEVLVAASRSISAPCPLASVYLLDRSSLHEQVGFEEVPDPRYLLASTFNNVLRTPDRLVRMLDVYAEVSRLARVVRINVPFSSTAADVAAAVWDHSRAAGEVRRPL